MRKTNKKGFTIVELVIVIAVIAILAAVLIPTYSSLVKKANLSADQQAVKQMNTVLAAQTEIPGNIADVKLALSTDGIDANNYKPLTADCEFYWDKGLNRIVMVDEHNSVLYPKDLAEKADSTVWTSLSGNGNSEKAEELVKEVGKATTGSTVTLSGKTNYMGASINLGLNLTSGQTLTIGGSDSSVATLTNFVSDEGSRVASNTGEYANVNYYPGLIKTIPAGTTVTVQNLVIDGAVIGDTNQPASAHVGIIAGDVSGTLIIKNVTIKNSTVFGGYMVGALVGNINNSGKVEIENVKIENTVVKGCAQTASLIGVAYKDSSVSFSNVSTDNLKVELSDYNNVGGAYAGVRTADNGNRYVTNKGTEYAYLTDKYVWYFDSSATGVENRWTTASANINTGE